MPKRKKPVYKKGHFLVLYDELLDSPAFRSLSNAAVVVLILLKRRFNGRNNGEIALSCRDCAKCAKMSRNTAQLAFTELQDKGFIKLECRGWFGTRQASTYTLTMDSNSGELQQPTNEWKQWGQAVPKESHIVPNATSSWPQNGTNENISVPN